MERLDDLLYFFALRLQLVVQVPWAIWWLPGGYGGSFSNLLKSSFVEKSVSSFQRALGVLSRSRSGV